jgi:hypothetical protein
MSLLWRHRGCSAFLWGHRAGKGGGLFGCGSKLYLLTMTLSRNLANYGGGLYLGNNNTASIGYSP